MASKHTVVGTSSFVAPYHLACPFMVMRSFILGPLDIGMLVVWPSVCWSYGHRYVGRIAIHYQYDGRITDSPICPWPTPSLDVCVRLKPTAV